MYFLDTATRVFNEAKLTKCYKKAYSNSDFFMLVQKWNKVANQQFTTLLFRQKFRGAFGRSNIFLFFFQRMDLISMNVIVRFTYIAKYNNVDKIYMTLSF